MSYKIEKRRRAFSAEVIDELLPVPHIHSHVELIYLKKGKSVAVLDNHQYVMQEGDFFIAFPNQLHYYLDEEPVEGYMFIFEADVFRELKSVFQKKLPELPIVHISDSEETIVRGMETICAKAEGEGRFDNVVAKGIVLSLLGELLAKMTFTDPTLDQDTIKRILNYCVENYRQPINLEMIAKELYLNKYYISHLFHERMQMSFKDFINKLRVEYSCELLKEGRSVTDVAYAAGFTSVRTYNRAFLKFMKMAPREYMKNK